MNNIQLNPPPKTKVCQCCGMKKEIRKTFRQTDPLGGVSASWECKDCINLDYESYIKKKNNNPDTVISELCPHCESEVVLDKVFKIQECPSCGKAIKPCSMCEMELVKCLDCKL